MSKKLLFITTRLFWPPDSGRKVSLYHYCKSFREDYGYEVHLYSFLEDGQIGEASNVPDFISSVTVATKASKTQIFKNLLKHSIGPNKWPLQTCLFYSDNNSRAIEELCTKLQPNVVIVDMIRLAEYYGSFSKVRGQKILDMDDLLSLRYEKMLEVGVKGNIAGAFANHVSGGFNSASAKKILLREEIKRLKLAEARLGRLYDSVVFVSENETKRFNLALGEDKAITATLGVDYDYFSGCKKQVNTGRVVSFVGNFRYAPNVDSLRYIVEEVLPRVSKSIKLMAIGMAPDDVVRSFEDARNVFFTGRVDDLRAYVGQTTLFLAPIMSGSGIKTKILEAMAMGMPVITNSIGAEGLSAVDGEHFIVRDNAEDIAAEIEQMLEDPDQCVRMGVKAQAYIRDNHVWSKVLRSFKDIGL